MKHHYYFCKNCFARIIRGVAGVTYRSNSRDGFAFANTLTSTETILNCFTRQNRKFGFTLAEVLITLGIIGIVAALVLPGMITKIEKQKNLAILKQAYSDLNQYLKMFDYEYDCDKSLTNCTPEAYEFTPKFTRYLYEKQKFGTPIKGNGYQWYLTIPGSGNNMGYSPLSTTKNANFLLSSRGGNYYLSIGPYMYDNVYTINKNKYGYFRARIFIYTNPKHISICRDICSQRDHSKAKVKAGLEIFELYITDTENIIPQGFPECGNHYYCKSLTDDTCSSKTKNYRGCLQKIIQDSWQMNY